MLAPPPGRNRVQGHPVSCWEHSSAGRDPAVLGGDGLCGLSLGAWNSFGGGLCACCSALPARGPVGTEQAQLASRRGRSESGTDLAAHTYMLCRYNTCGGGERTAPSGVRAAVGAPGQDPPLHGACSIPATVHLHRPSLWQILGSWGDGVPPTRPGGPHHKLTWARPLLGLLRVSHQGSSSSWGMGVGGSVPHEPGRRRCWRPPDALAAQPVLAHILTPRRLTHDHHPSAPRWPSPKVSPLATAQLSTRRVNGPGSMSGHQADLRVQPGAAVAGPCFHPDGVSVGLSSNYCPCGLIPSNRRVSTAGTSRVCHSLPAGCGASTGVGGTRISGDGGWGAGYCSAASRQAAWQAWGFEPGRGGGGRAFSPHPRTLVGQGRSPRHRLLLREGLGARSSELPLSQPFQSWDQSPGDTHLPQHAARTSRGHRLAWPARHRETPDPEPTSLVFSQRLLAAPVSGRTLSFPLLSQGARGTGARCRVRDKSPPQPPNPYPGLRLLPVLRG